MTYYVAFHLGHYCLQKYTFRCLSIQRFIGLSYIHEILNPVYYLSHSVKHVENLFKVPANESQLYIYLHAFTCGIFPLMYVHINTQADPSEHTHTHTWTQETLVNLFYPFSKHLLWDPKRSILRRP